MSRHRKATEKAPPPEEEDVDDVGEDDDDDGSEKRQFDPLAASLTSMEWLPRISVGIGYVPARCAPLMCRRSATQVDGKPSYSYANLIAFAINRCVTSLDVWLTPNEASRVKRRK